MSNVDQLATNLQRHLSSELCDLLARIAATAEGIQTTVWLVGGLIRDLLLDLPPQSDIDLAVEGDALALAQALVTALPGTRIEVSHKPFGTARLHMPLGANSIVVDLAMTRSESYAQPGALPQVAPARIQEDLFRRDFSVNAIAMRLLPIPNHPFGEVRDPFEGARNLQQRRLCLLHDASFRDDPTRMLRGIRLAARLGFQFEAHTQTLLQAAIDADYLAFVSAERVRAELCLTLEESQPEIVLVLAETLGLLQRLGPELTVDTALSTRLERARADRVVDPMVIAALVLYHCTSETQQQWVTRYRLPVALTRILQQIQAIQQAESVLIMSDTPPSTIDRILHPIGDSALSVVYYAASEPLCSVIEHYRHTMRIVAPLLSGDDLQRLGVPAGPSLGIILKELRAAQIDGLLRTVEQAEHWVRRTLESPHSSV